MADKRINIRLTASGQQEAAKGLDSVKKALEGISKGGSDLGKIGKQIKDAVSLPASVVQDLRKLETQFRATTRAADDLKRRLSSIQGGITQRRTAISALEERRLGMRESLIGMAPGDVGRTSLKQDIAQTGIEIQRKQRALRDREKLYKAEENKYKEHLRRTSTIERVYVRTGKRAISAYAGMIGGIASEATGAATAELRKSHAEQQIREKTIQGISTEAQRGAAEEFRMGATRAASNRARRYQAIAWGYAKRDPVAAQAEIANYEKDVVSGQFISDKRQRFIPALQDALKFQQSQKGKIAGLDMRQVIAMIMTSAAAANVIRDVTVASSNVSRARSEYEMIGTVGRLWGTLGGAAVGGGFGIASSLAGGALMAGGAAGRFGRGAGRLGAFMGGANLLQASLVGSSLGSTVGGTTGQLLGDLAERLFATRASAEGATGVATLLSGRNVPLSVARRLGYGNAEMGVSVTEGGRFYQQLAMAMGRRPYEVGLGGGGTISSGGAMGLAQASRSRRFRNPAAWEYLSSAATGAALGSMFAPGIGTGVGGILGTLAPLAISGYNYFRSGRSHAIPFGPEYDLPPSILDPSYKHPNFIPGVPVTSNFKPVPLDPRVVSRNQQGQAMLLRANAGTGGGTGGGTTSTNPIRDMYLAVKKIYGEKAAIQAAGGSRDFIQSRVMGVEALGFDLARSRATLTAAYGGSPDRVDAELLSDVMGRQAMRGRTIAARGRVFDTPLGATGGEYDRLSGYFRSRAGGGLSGERLQRNISGVTDFSLKGGSNLHKRMNFMYAFQQTGSVTEALRYMRSPKNAQALAKNVGGGLRGFLGEDLTRAVFGLGVEQAGGLFGSGADMGFIGAAGGGQRATVGQAAGEQKLQADRVKNMTSNLAQAQAELVNQISTVGTTAEAAVKLGETLLKANSIFVDVFTSLRDAVIGKGE